MERRIARPSSHPGTVPWTLVLLLGLSTSFRQGVAAGSRFSKLLQYFCQPRPDKCLSHLSLGSVGSIVGLERQTRCAASCHYLVISFRTTSGVRAEPPPTNAKHSSELSSLTSANYATTRLLLQRAATPALCVLYILCIRPDIPNSAATSMSLRQLLSSALCKTILEC